MRKSCAEVIHPLGQVCSNESRWNVLSPCLIQLLQDQSRWVKTAALRVLGYFISTFARSKPNDDGEDENAGHGETENENEAGREKGSGETKDAGSLSDQLNELVSLNDNEQFNDFNYWRDPIDHRIEFDEETKIQCNRSVRLSVSLSTIRSFSQLRRTPVSPLCNSLVDSLGMTFR